MDYGIRNCSLSLIAFATPAAMPLRYSLVSIRGGERGVIANRDLDRQVVGREGAATPEGGGPVGVDLQVGRSGYGAKKAGRLEDA